jgi:cell wall-associated NlpC family hydrolase
MMKRSAINLFAIALFVAASAEINHLDAAQKNNRETPGEIIFSLRKQFAPDPHLVAFDVVADVDANTITLVGSTELEKAKAETGQRFEAAGYKVKNEIELLPTPAAGEKGWALSCLSVANGRENPDHKAEMGDQILMGHPVQLLKSTRHWWYVRAADGYLSWVENGSVIPATRQEIDAWHNGRLLMVTAFESRILSEPRADSESVSDVVEGDLVKPAGKEGGWYKVELPDGRSGFLPETAAQEYAAWKGSRMATADAIEQTGKLFLGRPYLWGGNSPKGMDCSGFTSFVFYLNGISLKRNASEQATQGEYIEIKPDFSNLRKGDLLFFGRPGREDDRRGISHVAIYLGDKLFMQSSERVRISSFDASSPLYDTFHGRSALFARRILAN